MDGKVHTLREANLALRKHRRTKRTRIQDGGDVFVLDAQKVLAGTSVADEKSGEKVKMVAVKNGGRQVHNKVAIFARQVIMHEHIQRLKKKIATNFPSRFNQFNALLWSFSRLKCYVVRMVFRSTYNHFTAISYIHNVTRIHILIESKPFLLI